ncbi:reverse transcriptase domain-containing protein [Tanacetum coccineum]
MITNNNNKIRGRTPAWRTLQGLESCKYYAIKQSERQRKAVRNKHYCYECGNQGHYKSDCMELKNQNHENQAEGTKARGMVYAFGGGETEQYLNNIEDEIKA